MNDATTTYLPGDRRHGLPQGQWHNREAQEIAAHESPMTTKLYDRTTDQISLDEIRRIVI